MLPGCTGHDKKAESSEKKDEITYRSGAAGPTRLQLQDGTQVLLNASSVIRLSAGFNSQNRNLLLDGEALFTVGPHGSKPFVVHTKALVIADSGISGALFKVSGFSDSAGEEVDLLRGNLAIHKSYHSGSDNGQVSLKAGEMVMINTDIDLMEEESFDTLELKAWMEEKKK